MKNFILVCLFSFAILGQSQAGSVCSKLQKKADNICFELVCEEQMKELDSDGCEVDGDFHVAVQECAWDELQRLVAEYNKKNPGKKVACED